LRLHCIRASGATKLAGLQDAAASRLPRPTALTVDATTLTDVCSGEELPEVEIISLVQEQIPKYKLRADTLTSFTGYENQDWFIPSPALKPEEVETPLTPEQIRETLNYFLLCSNRVSQMTKTYNDIEAVTRLLEEKEKDIELTARIGKELLAHNSKLEANVATLENELKLCNEKITQLQHELLKKTELVQILTNDVDDSSSEAGTPTGKPPHFEFLQKKIGNLEEENATLKKEAARLADETQDCEEHEARLVADLVAQLDSCRSDLGVFGIETEKFRVRESELKEQIEHLQAKLEATDERLTQALRDNEEYITMVALSRETQCELATELAEVKEKYAEVVTVLEELRENAKKTKKKSQTTVRAGPLYPSLHSSVNVHNPDSIAAELECSLFSELSLDSGLGASTGTLPNYKKVFETVRCASRTSSLGSADYSTSVSPGLPQTSLFLPSSITSSTFRPRTSSQIAPPAESPHFSDIEEFSTIFPPKPKGTAEELEAALQKLTPAAVDARRAALSSGVFGAHQDIHTPDSIISGGSSAYAPWKLPDKLQIVKPLEGSLTLHHWSELATPSLGGLLDERPGVKIRGGTDLEALGLQIYSLSDIEEDEEVHPGKSFQDTNHIYTFTNSTVMHPDDNTSVTPSLRGSQMTTATSSRVSSMCPTPLTRSRRNSTSTVSTTPCLALLLQERGIKAATPSVFASPAFSPTATPCNSPERPSSPISEEEEEDDGSHSALGIPGFLMSSGAELLKTLGTALKSPSPSKPPSRPPSKKALVRPDKKAALRGIRLVEKIERIGLEEILSAPPVEKRGESPTTLHQVGLKRGSKKMESGGILGVPGRPGTGDLSARIRQLGKVPPNQRTAGRQVRPDLGSVPSTPSTSQPSPSLGTLSSLLFGRKGGLL